MSGEQRGFSSGPSNTGPGESPGLGCIVVTDILSRHIKTLTCEMRDLDQRSGEERAKGSEVEGHGDMIKYPEKKRLCSNQGKARKVCLEHKGEKGGVL